MSELTDEDVRRILQIVDELGDRDISFESGALKLRVARHARRSQALPAFEERAPAVPSAPATESRQARPR